MINPEKDSHLDLALPPAQPPATQRIASTFSSPKSFPTSAVTLNKRDKKVHQQSGKPKQANVFTVTSVYFSLRFEVSQQHLAINPLKN